MNEQDVLNKAYPILMKQGVASKQKDYRKGVGSCYYRHPDAKLVCFVGAVIPDEDYLDGFEKATLRDVMQLVPCLKDVSFAFLSEGQDIHDSSPVGDWPTLYAGLAKRWKLTLPEVG